VTPEQIAQTLRNAAALVQAAIAMPDLADQLLRHADDLITDARMALRIVRGVAP
jgi:hypothetical protein